MDDETGLHAWNPGLASGLPRAIRAQATVFRSENAETSFAECEELSDLCGLPATRLSLVRADRLVVHEILVRAMADLSIPMGSVYAELGVNFRQVVATILRDGVAPRLPTIQNTLRALREDANALMREEIACLFAPRQADPPPPPPRAWWARWAGRRSAPPPEPGASLEAALHRLAQPADGADDLRRAVREALRCVAGGILGRHGYLPREPDLLCRIGVILVSNGYGSRCIGILIEPWIDAIIAREGYRRVRAQARPVVMSVKGASASGKSTIRPYQRALAERMGLDWRDFAIITPDVWRKFLLDYDSLGDTRRYAGPLTGYEVEIIDEKLDLHMARKAAEGRMSHLLIDRFRFDSFSVESPVEGAGQLLSRFGHTVLLQFMVTPPEETVERAWRRGQEFGRYKAVEDLLAHNVEAFEGIPRLFFLWMLRRDKVVAFEFLDNTVRKGEVPRTIAYGGNDAMTILNPAALLDVERFRKINVNARTREEVYAGIDVATRRNGAFLMACLARLPEVRFAQCGTGRVYARFQQGRLIARDDAVLAEVCADAAIRDACEIVGVIASTHAVSDNGPPSVISAGLTLGSDGVSEARMECSSSRHEGVMHNLHAR